MNELQSNIDWLEKSPANRIEVYDAVTEKVIDKNLSAEKILSKFDNIEAYFLDLEQKGHTKIAIQKARKHGNTQVREGLMNKYLLGDKSQSVAGGGAVPTAPAPQPTQNQGMMGANTMGLSMPEIMQMNTAAQNYRSEKEKAERLERKVEKLEDENKVLDRKVLSYELGVEAKPGALEKLLDTISQNPDMITTAIQALAARKQPPGLGAPAENENENEISSTKVSLVQVISQPEVTDDIANAAYHLINQSLKGNAAFIEAFKKILIDHKLIKTA